MSIHKPVILLFMHFFLGVYAFSIDLSPWVKLSDRRHNPILLDFIWSEDKETSFTVLRALGQRSDLYMEDIIENIVNQYFPEHDEEILLETLLYSLFDSNEYQKKILFWVMENPKAYDLLVRNLPVFTDADLKTLIMRILPFGDRMDTKSYLMNEGQNILSEIEDYNGYLSSGRIRETLEFFSILDQMQDIDFAEICLAIAEKSRQKNIISKGRHVAGSLLRR